MLGIFLSNIVFVFIFSTNSIFNKSAAFRNSSLSVNNNIDGFTYYKITLFNRKIVYLPIIPLQSVSSTEKRRADCNLEYLGLAMLNNSFHVSLFTPIRPFLVVLIRLNALSK